MQPPNDYDLTNTNTIFSNPAWLFRHSGNFIASINQCSKGELLQRIYNVSAIICSRNQIRFGEKCNEGLKRFAAELCKIDDLELFLLKARLQHLERAEGALISREFKRLEGEIDFDSEEKPLDSDRIKFSK